MFNPALLAGQRLIHAIFGEEPAEDSADVNFKRAFASEPIEQIDVIKIGVPARAVEALARRMDVSKERLLGTLGLARATVNRKVRDKELLSPDETSRVLGMARLVGQVQTMVEAGGAPEGFDAAQWVSGWLERPLPALGGRRPAELMDTAEGQQLVAGLVARMQSGAYA